MNEVFMQKLMNVYVNSLSFKNYIELSLYMNRYIHKIAQQMGIY